MPCPGAEPATSRWPGHSSPAFQYNRPNRGGHFHAETKGPRPPARRSSGDRLRLRSLLHSGPQYGPPARRCARHPDGLPAAGAQPSSPWEGRLHPNVGPSGLRRGPRGVFALAPRRLRSRDLETPQHPSPQSGPCPDAGPGTRLPRTGRAGGCGARSGLRDPDEKPPPKRRERRAGRGQTRGAVRRALPTPPPLPPRPRGWAASPALQDPEDEEGGSRGRHGTHPARFRETCTRWPLGTAPRG